MLLADLQVSFRRWPKPNEQLTVGDSRISSICVIVICRAKPQSSYVSRKYHLGCHQIEQEPLLFKFDAQRPNRKCRINTAFSQNTFVQSGEFT